MRITLLSLSFLLLSINCFSQENEELDKRNGFKEIKLSVTIDSVKGTKYKKDVKEKNGAVGKLYEVSHPDYESIGEIAVNSIEVKAYKDLVYEIKVITEKDTRLMKALESVLGKPIYNVRDESYNWVGKTSTLKFKSHSKRELEMLYTSVVVHQKMRDDKAKKVEEIADDF